MVAPRAVWKGYLKVGSVSCAVKLIGATSESERIHFKTLNRQNRTPVRAAYVDEQTNEVVEADDQVKGYEVSNGDFLVLDSEEIKRLKPTSEHTLEVDGFVDISAIDQRYLEKPYYVVPADAGANEPFAVIREALRARKAAARSCIVLYQRGREVILQAEGKGMLMTTLRTHNEMISAESIFGKGDKKSPKADPEMMEIAGLLIDKKVTKFDPSKFEDRYEDALAAMLEAKRKGKAPPKPVPAPRENVVNLADVLRKSLAKEGITRPKATAPRKKSA